MFVAVFLGFMVFIAPGIAHAEAIADPTQWEQSPSPQQLTPSSQQPTPTPKQPTSTLKQLTPTSKIGIIAAMDPELDLLVNAVSDPVVEKIAGISFVAGKIGDHPVVISKCGVGKVSAALGTQLMIDRFAPDFIVNTGCAGGLQPEVAIKDIVLASGTVEWDLDTTMFDHPRGYVHALDREEMVTDSRLVRQIERHVPDNMKVHKGLVISGDSFVATKQQRSALLGYFPSAKCVEMEGSAVGHVCAQNGVPFCVLRCISDDCREGLTVDYNEFEIEASRTAADILLRFLREEAL